MNKLIINKTQILDLSAIVSMELDIENSQFISPNTIDEHSNLIEDSNIVHLTFKLENDEIIGFAILAGLLEKNREVEFRRIVIKQKGKGYGRIAIKQIKKYCFQELNCHRLWLDVLENNKRARYLYQSEGFKEEGKLEDCLITKNEFKSLIVMSMLQNEYLEITDNLL